MGTCAYLNTWVVEEAATRAAGSAGQVWAAVGRAVGRPMSPSQVRRRMTPFSAATVNRPRGLSKLAYSIRQG